MAKFSEGGVSLQQVTESIDYLLRFNPDEFQEHELKMALGEGFFLLADIIGCQTGQTDEVLNSLEALRQKGVEICGEVQMPHAAGMGIADCASPILHIAAHQLLAQIVKDYDMEIETEI